LPFKDVIVGSSRENHNESSDNYLEKMRYMMQNLVDLMNRGSLALVLVSSYHSSSLNHWITLTAHIAQQNKAHLSP